jgi:fermentation-respiration switch protein FrsA (DUF1100 family)
MTSVWNKATTEWFRRGWHISRPFVVAYLIILLGMMLLEPQLVYPIPSAKLGDWKPAGLVLENVWFRSADGTKLHGWFVPHPRPERAILYCHGNGEHIAFNAQLALQLRDKLSASVFLFDYRGYGRSEGRPTESGCIADGRAAQRWLAERMRIEPSDVVLIGRSLGGAVAVALAASEGARALVLESTFPSACDVAGRQFGWLPVRWAMDNRYDSFARIRQFRGPVFQCHGSSDRLIPIELGRKLFHAAPTRMKQFVELPGFGHNDAWPMRYYDLLADFLILSDIQNTNSHYEGDKTSTFSDLTIFCDAGRDRVVGNGL